MNTRRALIFIVLLSMCSFLSNARQNELKKKRLQLDKLHGEINRFEDQIKEKEKNEHATLELLDTYDRQATLLRKLIRKLHEEEESVQHDINETKQTVGELSGQVSFLKRHYANYVTAAYTSGPTYDLELLLSSKSLNQLLVRSEYLTRFSEQRRKDLSLIDTRRTELENQRARLEDELAQQQQLIEEKSREEGTFAHKMKKRKRMLADIRKDKKNYRREINRKIDAAKELEQIIAKLIEQDRLKKEREPKSKTLRPSETAQAAGAEDIKPEGAIQIQSHQGDNVGSDAVERSVGNGEQPRIACYQVEGDGQRNIDADQYQDMEQIFHHTSRSKISR